MSSKLTGNYLVRGIRPGFHDAKKWFPRKSDEMDVRRHALKLRFWPSQSPVDEGGNLLDLDWCWIKATQKKRLNIAELRIHDVIGGHDNIRIIFFDPQIKSDPLPMLWVLAVLQKKRDDFSTGQLSMFKLRRQLVLERFYSGHS